MRVDFFATQSQYVDHLVPVWFALEVERRGAFLVPGDLMPYLNRWGIVPAHDYDPASDTVVTAGWLDAVNWSGPHRRVLMEHGCGQQYDGGHASYAGAEGRDAIVDVFLAPNARVLEANERGSPGAEHYLVGTPKMDRYFNRVYDPHLDVAVSFHWDCRDVAPEAQSTFDYWKPGVLELRDRRPILGHGHPRDWPTFARWYADESVVAACDFQSVINTCRSYACDNSSTLYEFAALDRPVVVLNHPRYRRDVELGLRFWEFADVGVQVDEPSLLPAAVERALEDPPVVAERRRAITDELFPFRDGSCASRVVEALSV